MFRPIFHLMCHIKKFIEATKPRYMRTRPVLHEAENEADAKTHEAEATNFGLEAVLASRLNIPDQKCPLSLHKTEKDGQKWK